LPIAIRPHPRPLYQRQKGEYCNLFAADDVLDAAQRQAQDTYMRHVKVARVALKMLKIARAALQDRPLHLEKISVAAPARRASRPSAAVFWL